MEKAYLTGGFDAREVLSLQGSVVLSHCPRWKDEGKVRC
jgi:hypothetical protein